MRQLDMCCSKPMRLCYLHTHYSTLRSLHTHDQTPAMGSASYIHFHIHTAQLVLCSHIAHVYRTFAALLFRTFHYLPSHNLTIFWRALLCVSANSKRHVMYATTNCWFVKRGSVLKCYNNKAATVTCCFPIEKPTD